jgi:hypothetical protein
VVQTLTGERRTPGYIVRTPRVGPRPPGIQSGPPRLVLDLHVCKPDPWDGVRGAPPPPPPRGGAPPPGAPRTQAGSSTNTCHDLVWCEPVHIRLCSPPRRRPDAATWPTTRDVSQRVEPDVRPPGYAAPAFIADKARRLTGNVSPRHLMRHAHSAVRRRPIHSTGKQCAASAFNETCPFRWQAACLSIPLAGGTPMLSHALYSSSLVRTKGATVVCQHCAGSGHLGARRSLRRHLH